MEKTAIQFSGGKDSLAVLHLLSPLPPETTVYFCDTGDMYPHVLDFVDKTCLELQAKIKIVRPDVPIGEFHAQHGLPSDIVPMSRLEVLRKTFGNKGVSLQSSISCCSAMLWDPLQKAMRDDDIRVIVRGSKEADEHVGVPDGFVDERGVVYKSPLWTWTDADVFNYLREKNVELPEHYKEIKNSFDCVGCPAFLAGSGEAGRLAWTRKHLPERWRVLKENVRLVRAVVDEERAKLEKSFAEVD